MHVDTIVNNATAAFGAVLGLRSGWIAAHLFKDWRKGEIGWAGSLFFGCISMLGFRLVPASYVTVAPLWARLWKLTSVIMACISLEFFYMELQEDTTDEKYG